MPTLRFRVELNKGRLGIPLSKLVGITSELHKFFGLLAKDAHITKDITKWSAQNFEDGCVAFDVQYQEDVPPSISSDYLYKFRTLAKVKSPKDIVAAGISDSTAAQYAKIASRIDEDEKVRIAPYQNGGKDIEQWYEIDKDKAKPLSSIQEEVKVIDYYGTIQGILTAWHMKPSKSLEKPWVWMRNLEDNSTVKCIYKESDYGKVAHIAKLKDAVFFVSGIIYENLEERAIEYIEAEHFEAAEDFSEEDFNKFFGCAPDLTGELNAAEYIDRIRDEEG